MDRFMGAPKNTSKPRYGIGRADERPCHCEEVVRVGGQPTKQSLDRGWFLRRLMTVVSGLLLVPLLSSQGHCLCPPPLDPQIRKVSDGSVAVTWFHPDCFAETLTAHQGDFKAGFYPGDVQSPRVAFRLPTGLARGRISAIGAYFYAAKDVLEEEWDSLAAFAWSIHVDSAGFPGRMVAPEVTWDLGDPPWLRAGRFGYGEVDWLIPESNGDSLWLIGHWLPGSESIVRMGRDSSQPALETWVGCSEEGQDVWPTQLPNGLLVDVVILRSRPPGAARAEGFLVISEATAGPEPRHTDTTFGTFADGLQFLDTNVVVGQTRRYSVASLCAAETSVFVATPAIDIFPHWGILLPNNEIDLRRVPGNDTAGKFTITNLCLNPLSANFDSLVTVSASPLTLRVVPDTLSLSGEAAGTVSFICDCPDCDAGLYRGQLRFQVRSSAGPAVDQWSIPIRLTVDAATAISNLSGGDVPEGENRHLDVRVQPNPWRDRLVIDITLPGSVLPDWDESASGLMPASGPQVAVFNIIGAQIAITESRLAGHMLRLGDGMRCRVDFPDSGAWPSGVYFCRVRWGRYLTVVPVVRIR